MTEGVKPKSSRSKAPKQRWGPMIAELRNSKGWNMGQLLRRYHRVAAKRFSDDEDVDYSLDQVWLRRAESGVRVKNCERYHIELLIEALGCDVVQRWDILQAAGYDYFADMNGDVDEVARVLKRLFTQLSSSKKARRTVERWLMHNEEDTTNWQLLIDILQSLAEMPTETPGPAPKPAPA